MKRIQYTLRAVPVTVDRALRRKARAEGRSLNTIVVETLARGLELELHKPAHTDLDDLIGTWVEDSGFELAQADFSRPEHGDGT